MSYTVDLTSREGQQEWMDEYGPELCDLAWTGRRDSECGKGVVLVAAHSAVDPKAAWEYGTVFLEQISPGLDYDPETQFILRFVWQADGKPVQVDFRVTYPPGFDRLEPPAPAD